MHEALICNDAPLRGMHGWLNRSDDMFCDSGAEIFSIVAVQICMREALSCTHAPPRGSRGMLSCKGAALSTNEGARMVSKNTICLWFDGGAEDAARFYADTFADSAVHEVFRAPSDYPSGKDGDVLTVAFTVMGIPCLGLNGGPGLPHSEAFSFQVATDDQAETDRLWHAIVENGGQASACGWCKDRWGVSWQITPRVLTSALASPDRAMAKRVFEVMMGMGKIEIAGIEGAMRG
jgi:predicted 3-demethylubiquinone-9 3-methyltransferase (glyoxalase superfamily)